MPASGAPASAASTGLTNAPSAAAPAARRSRFMEISPYVLGRQDRAFRGQKNLPSPCGSVEKSEGFFRAEVGVETVPLPKFALRKFRPAHKGRVRLTSRSPSAAYRT